MASKRIIVWALTLVVAGMACAIGSSSTSPGEGTPGAGASPRSPLGTPGTSDASMLPVSINQGLASLDNYHMTFVTDVFDSVAQQRTVTTLVVARNREADASHNSTETLVTTGDGEMVSEEVQEQYIIGNQLCNLSEGEAQFSSMSEMERVMMGLMSQVVDFNPLIENPEYVGQEVVNGVPARTYTFEVRSLGAASEVEVSRSDGSYAIAVDGAYLLRYRLDLELRTGQEGDPEAQSSISSFDLTLEEINQPQDISFPDTCVPAESDGG